MRKLARSIAIFLITSYIDAVYRYAYTHPDAIPVGASLLAMTRAVTSSIDVCLNTAIASKLAPTEVC